MRAISAGVMNESQYVAHRSYCRLPIHLLQAICQNIFAIYHLTDSSIYRTIAQTTRQLGEVDGLRHATIEGPKGER